MKSKKLSDEIKTKVPSPSRLEDKKAEANPQDDGFLEVFIFKNNKLLGQNCFSKDKISVGKSKNADLVLNGENISDIHAFFHLQNDHVQVSDGNQGSGVIVNGKRVSTSELCSLDQVTIGPFILQAKLKNSTNQTSETEELPADTPVERDNKDNVKLDDKDNVKLDHTKSESIATPSETSTTHHEENLELELEGIKDQNSKIPAAETPVADTQPEIKKEEEQISATDASAPDSSAECDNNKDKDKDNVKRDDTKSESIATPSETSTTHHEENLELELEDIKEQDYDIPATEEPEPPLTDIQAELHGREEEISTNDDLIPYTPTDPEDVENALDNVHNEDMNETENTTLKVEQEIINIKENRDKKKEVNDYGTERKFSLKEKLIQFKQTESHTVEDQMVLEVIKCRGNNVIDMCFLKRKEKYCSINEDGRFCLAENKNNKIHYFFFNDQFNGNVKFSDSHRVDISTLCTSENLYRKRKKIYRCPIPLNGVASINDGYYDYYFRIAVLNQNSTIPGFIERASESMGEKNHVLTNLLKSIAFHITILVVAGLLFSFLNPSLPPSDTNQLKDNKKMITQDQSKVVQDPNVQIPQKK